MKLNKIEKIYIRIVKISRSFLFKVSIWTTGKLIEMKSSDETTGRMFCFRVEVQRAVENCLSYGKMSYIVSEILMAYQGALVFLRRQMAQIFLRIRHFYIL